MPKLFSAAVALSKSYLTCASFVIALLLPPGRASAQTPAEPLDHVTHAASFTFVKRDGTCVRGTIASASPHDILVQVSKDSSVKIERGDLLQVGHGNALLYSARSSWSDVARTHIYSRESIVLVLHNGKHIGGETVRVAPSEIAFRHGFLTRTYKKSDIAKIDYLRLKPESDMFDLVLEEAPFFIFLYPEAYYRMAGLEGRVPVHLYDDSKPEDDSPNCFTPFLSKGYLP